jgi:hypothetical protein
MFLKGYVHVDELIHRAGISPAHFSWIIRESQMLPISQESFILKMGRMSFARMDVIERYFPKKVAEAAKRCFVFTNRHMPASYAEDLFGLNRGAIGKILLKKNEKEIVFGNAVIEKVFNTGYGVFVEINEKLAHLLTHGGVVYPIKKKKDIEYAEAVFSFSLDKREFQIGVY